MSEGTEQRALLRSELLRYGRAVTVTRTTPGAYVPATGATGAATTAAKTGLGRVGVYSDAAKANTLILQNDRHVTWQPDAAYTTFIPQEGDVVTAGSDAYTVISFNTIELEGDWICYILQVRS